MKLLYSTYSNNYTPISFRDRYLYDTYEIIISFLRGKLSPQELDKLLKPVLNANGEIAWYGNMNGSFSKINELSEERAQQLKLEFDQFLKKCKSISYPLTAKKDIDSKEWGNLLDTLFQHDKIILIGNENGDWGMLWGWDFKTQNDNRLPVLPPSIKPAVPVSEPEVRQEEPVTPAPVQPTFQNTQYTEQPTSGAIKEEQPIPVVPIIDPAIVKHRVGFWERIKRILRWISYRFWGLFWLIIYTLLIIWLCKSCNKPDCGAMCNDLEKTKQELLDLQNRVHERCDTTYVKK